MTGQSRILYAVVGLVLGFALAAWPQAQDAKKKDRPTEESVDYFQKWLKQDVVYIITNEERDLFEKLQTPDEKENFIEQFWLRRDPDPRTAANEFKIEHYRRIAYANEHFPSGDPGWMTDRGRIYILHGQPDSIESRPTGGVYIRPVEEGGGNTSVYPFEKWRYRHIEGVGDDVVLEFVDPSFTGEFRLASSPWEKDAFLHSPEGATLAEQYGLATKADRDILTPAQGGAGNNPQNMFRRLRDAPFARYETLARAQAAKPIKYKDLKEFVSVNVEFSNLPFEVRSQYFRLNERQVLVPVTVQVRNQDLTFNEEAGRRVARMAVYGLVTSITNRYILEFDEEITTSYSPEDFQKGLEKTSVYQKVIPVDGKVRYKLDMVMKDLNSGAVGVLRRALIPPNFPQELSASSLILADSIEELDVVPDGDEAFLLGNVRVLPNLERRFTDEMPLGVYFHVYNFSFDQAAESPALSVAYRLFKDGQLLRMAVDEQGESTQFFSPQRAVIAKLLSLGGLESGRYEVQIEVTDRISQEKVEIADAFEIVPKL